MTCGELEILLCDYLDSTLPETERAALERHLSTCEACSDIARDAASVAAFIDGAAVVEPPPQLLTRILDESLSGRHGQLGKVKGFRGGVSGWFAGVLAPALQPRLVMGMALTVLSFSMMARCAGISPRQLQPADLQPAKVWASLDDRVHRTWNRSVQFYESIRFVYELRSRLRQWTEQQEEEDRNAAAKKPVSERKLPSGPEGTKQ